MNAPVIVWFRRNLRLADNPALADAAASGQPLIPVYIRDENTTGAASDWWLHESLAALTRSLAERGLRLQFFAGRAAEVLPRLAAATGAGALCFSRGYSALAIAEQDSVECGLKTEVHAFDDTYLRAPGTVLTQEDRPYRVYTPFWKASRELGEPGRPLPEPDRIVVDPSFDDVLRSLPGYCRLDDFRLLPTRPDWSGGLRSAWTPGEDGAHARLELFADLVAHYADCRDRPDVDMTSRLSPHLHFGEVSPRQVWHAIHDAAESSRAAAGAEAYLRQLHWRDFNGQLLYHFPEMPVVPLREEYGRFPWAPDPELLAAWQAGRTGYPIVDAGMRELWATGWMHNRVRMIVASFLVKNLLIPWQQGAEWFLDTLVDADLANNSANWQWVAGCGTDAAPYFRIYNPVLQSRKFDPDGRYVRRWVPELARLPDTDLHEPWLADRMTQRTAGVSIGDDYPEPLVEFAQSRERALDAYRELRSLVQSPAVSPGSSAG
ncbi:MAG TPA: deoxyribodipyrimidine photo-lyase [Woeseiaceae bacterium]|nr:deoxyribodipyrimidine photo-lyase [Woeseiaceae bacterium]